MTKWKFLHTFCFEIEAETECSGSHQPAKTYGPPENCYPEEGDDERNILKLTIDGKALPDALGKPLAAWLEEHAVMREDLPYQDPDPGYDDRDD